MILELAKAKVNLDLHVVRRREDGYHDLDSLVVFPDLGDGLVLEKADTLTLAIEGPFAQALGDESDNLVLEAARRLGEMVGRSPDVAITLTKRLPVSAGIGGGSADAAAALRGLVRLWDLPFSFGDLVPLAVTLGADVPVCLPSTPARMTGIGDRLAAFALPRPLPILLANPGQPVSTPAIFKALTDMTGKRRLAPEFRDEASFFDALHASENDLEAPARALLPEIAEVLSDIDLLPGCRLARMSGSGATCFGLFEDETSLGEAAAGLAAARPAWWVAPSVCS